jgi:uncharacterized protein
MPPRTLFADAFYWVALIFPRDTFHARVRSFSATLGPTRLVTTDEVLTEVLNHFSHLGPIWRAKSAALVHAVRNNPDVDVLPQTRAEFDASFALYEARLETRLLHCQTRWTPSFRPLLKEELQTRIGLVTNGISTYQNGTGMWNGSAEQDEPSNGSRNCRFPRIRIAYILSPVLRNQTAFIKELEQRDHVHSARTGMQWRITSNF